MTEYEKKRGASIFSSVKDYQAWSYKWENARRKANKAIEGKVTLPYCLQSSEIETEEEKDMMINHDIITGVLTGLIIQRYGISRQAVHQRRKNLREKGYQV